MRRVAVLAAALLALAGAVSCKPVSTGNGGGGNNPPPAAEQPNPAEIPPDYIFEVRVLDEDDRPGQGRPIECTITGYGRGDEVITIIADGKPVPYVNKAHAFTNREGSRQFSLYRHDAPDLMKIHIICRVDGMPGDALFCEAWNYRTGEDARLLSYKDFQELERRAGIFTGTCFAVIDTTV